MKTTTENVKSQLMYEWEEEQNDEGDYFNVKGKQLMSEQEALAMIERHRDIMERCQLLGSYAYYAANEIRKAESQPA